MATLYLILKFTPFFAVVLLPLLALGFLPVLILNKIRKKSQRKTLVVWASMSGILVMIGIASFVGLNRLERIDRIACEKSGGTWSYALLHSIIRYNYPFYCDFPTIDAGKKCTDSSQCVTFCAPPSEESARSADIVIGTCYGRTNFPNEGCFERIDDGKIHLSGGCAF